MLTKPLSLASAEEIQVFSVAAEAALLIGESHWRQGEVEQSVDWFLSSSVRAEHAGNDRLWMASAHDREGVGLLAEAGMLITEFAHRPP